MWLWAMLALYAAARVLQLFADRVPMLVIVVLHVVPAGAFAILHGARIYGRRGILVFACLCVGTGAVFEIVGVHTGVPFGRYYFTNLMGPKVFDVPVMHALAYLGMGYLSWTLAAIIVGRPHPVLAACIMVSWDLAMDPIWSTVMHAWVWLDGGAWFGVPVLNYIGWFLTALTSYSLFAVYVRRRPAAGKVPPQYWRMAIVFYAVSAAGNLLLVIPKSPRPVADIARAAALVTIFTMGTFSLLAWLRTNSSAR
jgi:putative membrane protein